MPNCERRGAFEAEILEWGFFGCELPGALRSGEESGDHTRKRQTVPPSPKAHLQCVPQVVILHSRQLRPECLLTHMHKLLGALIRHCGGEGASGGGEEAGGGWGASGGQGERGLEVGRKDLWGRSSATVEGRGAEKRETGREQKGAAWTSLPHPTLVGFPPIQQQPHASEQQQ